MRLKFLSTLPLQGSLPAVVRRGRSAAGVCGSKAGARDLVVGSSGHLQDHLAVMSLPARCSVCVCSCQVHLPWAAGSTWQH